MLKRPQWVKEKIEGREKTVPIQMTVKKKYSMPIDDSYVGMQTVSARNTGSGVDGEVQPGKMVDVQVHEGEGIIPNNAMQGLTGEEFQGLVETLSSGNIDKNKLREAINMPAIQEFQNGGIAYSGVPSSKSSRSRGVPDERAEDVEPEPTITKQEYLNRRFPNYGTNKDESIQTSAVTRETPTAPTIRVAAPQQQTIATSEVQAAEPAAAKPTETTTAQIAAPQEPIQTQEVQREAAAAPVVKAPTAEIQAPAEEAATTTEETVTQPTVSYAGEMVRQGLQNILAEAQGVSEVDRKIANFYLQNIDASNAANLRLLESQISADPEMSDQAKRAAIAGLQREAAAQRSETAGELAISAAERSSQAARDLVTYGGQVRSYEEIELPQARQNLEIADWTFENYTKPMSELEIQALESELGTQNWNEIQQMINQGIGINRVNEKLAEKGIDPLSTDEYANILQAGSLGERNWNRQLAAAELSTTLGNYEAAAEQYSNLFEGVDFDFSSLATQEKAETFSQGLSNMASYVAADYDLDTALEAMKADGTLELMGIDEGQLAQMYNAANVNALDKEWEEIETSQDYQALLNSDDPADQQLAEDIKEVNRLRAMGLLEYNIVHEYKITSPTGEAKGSVYAKTAEEAQEKANEYGVDYTVEDTGNVGLVEREEPTTEIEEPADIADKWEEFKATVPPELVDQDLYKRWESWQKDNTGGYEEFLKTEPLSNQLVALEVEENKDLLEGKNPKILAEAYENDPESVKDKGYYWTPPTAEELKGGLSTKTGGFLGTGATKTSVSDKLKQSFADAVGQMTEIPMADGTVIGQIQDIEVGPRTVDAKVQLLNGEIKTVRLYDSDHGSYRPQPKYYGSKG